MLTSVIIFLFGLIAGSFLNCVIYRLEKKEGFLSSRSYCPHCKHILTWQDLMPVLSFIILKGKCRYCRQGISLQYPLVELATGALFVLIFNFQTIFNFLFLLIIACLLMVVFIYDLKYYLIPDGIVYSAITLTFLYRLFGILEFETWNLFRISGFEFRISESLIHPLAAGFAAAIFFLGIVLVSRGKWMGVGDIKLAFLLGLLLGWPNVLVALFFSFMFGAIIGLGLIVAAQKTLRSEVPFGPFLVSGAFLALFFGRQIIHWYLNLFLW